MTMRVQVLAWLAVLVVTVLSCDDDDASGGVAVDASQDASAIRTQPEAGPATSGGFVLTACVPFGVFSCCAWYCRDGEFVAPCPTDIPGLGIDDDRQDWVECFESKGFTEDAVDFTSPRWCEAMDVDLCERIVTCVRGKGGVAALEAMGYPPPGSTTSCPAPPVVSADDAGDGDAGG